MRGINRNCRQCGKPFTVDGTCGGKCYCSDECRKQHQKNERKIIWKKWYDKHKSELSVKPHLKTCKYCGNSFLGKYNQLYCADCLENGGTYMHKLRDQRSTDFSLLEVK